MKRKLIFKIVLAGMLLALILIIKQFTFQFNIAGYTPIQVGFDSLFVSTSGMLLGPIFSFIVSVAADNLGYFLSAQTYAYNPIYGLVEVVCGLSGAMMVIFCRRIRFRQSLKYISTFSYFILFMFAIYYVYTKETYKVNTQIIVIAPNLRIIAASILLISFIISIILLLVFESRIKENTKLVPFSGLVLIRIITELANIIITPLCLYFELGMPLEMNMLVRVYKSIILIPIYSILLFILLKAIEQTKLVNKLSLIKLVSDRDRSQAYQELDDYSANSVCDSKRDNDEEEYIDARNE